MEKEKERKKSTSGMFLGSIAFAIAIYLLVPTIIDKGATYLYNSQKTNSMCEDDDDWGPEIVKKANGE